MDDLVSRRYVLDRLEQKRPEIGADGSRDRHRYMQWYADREAVVMAPSAQPEIIRCKDCKHKPNVRGVNHDISFPDEVCPCQCADYWYSWMPKDDWYCANAERRTDE